ncbi:MAG: hypothetical protein IBJ07_03980 [Rhizobiaceae bacterium]|nr:hypothetical protein [Rhizobiaceae bacterium]
MPLHRKAEEAGIISPAELALLARVFEATKRAGENETEREARASRILGYYLAGIDDEDELKTLARQPLQR